MFAVLAGIAAFALTFTASYSCYYWVFEETNPFNYDDDQSYAIPFDYSMGIFTYHTYSCNANCYDKCVPYTWEQLQFLDQPFKVAYVCAILANIFTGVSMLLLLLKVSSYAVSKSFLKVIGVLSIGGWFFMALTFYSYKSKLTGEPFNATFSKNSRHAILSCVMSILTSGLSFAASAQDSTLQAPGAEPDREPAAKPTTESA